MYAHNPQNSMSRLHCQDGEISNWGPDRLLDKTYLNFREPALQGDLVSN